MILPAIAFSAPELRDIMLRKILTGAAVSLALALALALGACAADSVGPSQAVEEGIEIRLDAPAEVAAHEPFDVTLVVTNRHQEPVTLTTMTSCLVRFGIFSDGERVPFERTLLGCYEAITHHEIAAGDSLERTWPIRAELAAPPERKEEPVPPWSYRVRAESRVVEIDGQPARLPDLERRLVVR